MSMPSSEPLAPPSPADGAASAAPPRVRQARAATLALVLMLAALCAAWELWLAPTGRGTLAIKALPLLPCVPGLLRHRLYTFRALSLLVWLYVLEGLVRATSERGLSQALALAEVALSVALFVLCVIYIRLRLPRRRRGESSP
ncbi:MAG: DUF2069 domain-containing protein [Rubrivivax sp.]